jgi:hypothetical protein
MLTSRIELDPAPDSAPKNRLHTTGGGVVCSLFLASGSRSHLQLYSYPHPQERRSAKTLWDYQDLTSFSEGNGRAWGRLHGADRESEGKDRAREVHGWNAELCQMRIPLL